jgi:hypothetical protein
MFFSQELYDAYNNHGIQVAVSFLRQLGYEPVSFDERYKYDFTVSKDGKEYKVETEVSQKWKNRQFPYRNMSVPYRKKDYTADFYIRTNPSGTALFFLPMKDVFEAPVIRKDTSYTQNEPFFNVDTKNLTLYYYEDDAWYCDS